MAANDLRIRGGRHVIPAEELDWSYARSSGPGGQNVNKRETKAVLRWVPRASPTLPASIRRRLEVLAAGRINAEGELLIASDVHRERERNVDDCRRRLLALLEQAAEPPKPRHKTKPTFASKKRRLTAKKVRGAIKSRRGRVSRDDD